MPSVTSNCGLCSYGVPTNTLPRWINERAPSESSSLLAAVDACRTRENPGGFVLKFAFEREPIRLIGFLV
jgi:hypothetical protein